ncbi:MAG: transcription antitermination protein NusB [Sphingomonadaceae bacterium]|uniref:transcription antitermination protein NusB n=1 Tax=Thermaurantiacus sp. TaxID=2820283 RepID=UPI00298ED4C8|nr:transcription antitermination protein NusB [Thermaurantiacus sp.]MCS6985987.1 transcription antitermination protein NusB [Sphingomonadaceae bacterium]MDW8414797.1 transcription antitermination protein NusB [Thermaurantiacus sp.]
MVRQSTGTLGRARAVARLRAVQALYQHALAGTPPARLLAEFHAYRLPGSPKDRAEDDEGPLAEADEALFDDLVNGAIARADELDAYVRARLTAGWALERLPLVLRALLRAAAYELVARPDVPAGVVAKEYADIAAAFHPPQVDGDGRPRPAPEVGFVNALVDRLARELREPST